MVKNKYHDKDITEKKIIQQSFDCSDIRGNVRNSLNENRVNNLNNENSIEKYK